MRQIEKFPVGAGMIHEFCWSGSEDGFADRWDLESCGHIFIGRYGGSSGQGTFRNEDGLLAWCADDRSWEFAVVLDAHASSDSTELVLNAILEEKAWFQTALEGESSEGRLFAELEKRLLHILQSESFRLKCEEVRGECSMLAVCRKGEFLWWFSVGDCMLLLLHPELFRMGQTMVNQRNFFEWVGRVNAFDLRVPCYSSGRRQLRQGFQLIGLTTDGYWEDATGLSRATVLSLMDNVQTREGIEKETKAFLADLHRRKYRDSTTLAWWSVLNEGDACMPSRIIV